MYTTTYNENGILYDIFQFEFLMRITIQEDQWLHIEFIKSHLLSLLCHYFDDDILHYLLICHLFFLRVSALLSIHFLYLLWLYVSYKIIMINVTDLWISSFFASSLTTVWSSVDSFLFFINVFMLYIFFTGNFKIYVKNYK